MSGVVWWPTPDLTGSPASCESAGTLSSLWTVAAIIAVWMLVCVVIEVVSWEFERKNRDREDPSRE